MKPKTLAKRAIRRRRRNGQDERIKNDASARNARPKRVTIKHGGHSLGARFGVLDRRTRAFRQEQRLVALYLDHFGGLERCSMPLRALIQQAARLELLSGIAWCEIARSARVSNCDGSAPSGASVAYLSAARALRELLFQFKLDRPIFTIGQTVQDMTDEELERIARRGADDDV